MGLQRYNHFLILQIFSEKFSEDVKKRAALSSRTALKGVAVQKLFNTDLTIFLSELLEREGGLANASLGGFVLDLVDVGAEGCDLLFNLGNEFLHDTKKLIKVYNIVCVETSVWVQSYSFSFK